VPAARQRLGARSALAVACLSLLLGAAGCGSDEEKSSAPPPPPQREPTATAPSATAPPPDAPRERPGDGRRPEDPESAPGGAGDEDGARAPADLTGRGGRITPRLVQVPPFLAVRVTLRSADGREYGLRFGDRELRTRRSASLEIDGLRPGERLVGRPAGEGSRVVIEASAEPGP